MFIAVFKLLLSVSFYYLPTGVFYNTSTENAAAANSTYDVLDITAAETKLCHTLTRKGLVCKTNNLEQKFLGNLFKSKLKNESAALSEMQLLLLCNSQLIMHGTPSTSPTSAPLPPSTTRSNTTPPWTTYYILP